MADCVKGLSQIKERDNGWLGNIKFSVNEVYKKFQCIISEFVLQETESGFREKIIFNGKVLYSLMQYFFENLPSVRDK